VLAVFSIGDMIVYNRRKRAIYFAEQEKEQAKILGLARTAVAEGHATPAQAALVAGIAEEEELMEKKKAERKIPSKLLWWLHGDWKEDKDIAEQRKLAVEDFKKVEAEMGRQVQDAQEGQAGVLSTSTPVVGGPLDNAAAKATQTAEEKSKGWLGWLWGGSKKE
jgi:hypothetical protein